MRFWFAFQSAFSRLSACLGSKYMTWHTSGGHASDASVVCSAVLPSHVLPRGQPETRAAFDLEFSSPVFWCVHSDWSCMGCLGGLPRTSCTDLSIPVSCSVLSVILTHSDGVGSRCCLLVPVCLVHVGLSQSLQLMCYLVGRRLLVCWRLLSAEQKW